MKQAQIAGAFGIDQVRVVEVPEPVAGAGQVLVRIHATSLNYRDFLVATGKYNPKMPLPRVLLSDGAGEVVAVGAGVTRFRIGDRVAGTFFQNWIDGPFAAWHGASALGGAIDGVLSELVALSEEGLVAVPAGLSYAEAATLPCAALTAWNALFEAGQLKAGQSVLVQGSGGVSVFALQFARAAGARVVATTSTTAKAERLRTMGADWVLNYRETPEWGREIAKAGGVDHVVEVGGSGTLEQSLHAVKASGQVNMIGVLTGRVGEVNTGLILSKSVRVQGIYVGSRAMFERMNAAIAVNGIRPVIDSSFALAETQNALRHLEGATHFGKVVITVP